jgi:hypothetical protein
MKLSVLVPSGDYQSFAGARIRYHRVAPFLCEQGIELSVEEIGQFSARQTSAAAVLISKCHDARALMVASVLRDRGKLVGVDLFDDYFSQFEDSRLVRFRNWLADLLPLCDFALCSTKRMGEVVGNYRRDLPVHIMNDPAAVGSADAVFESIARKVKKARETGRFRLAWFGVGDNSYFPVGLRDLATCAPLLNDLSRGAYEVQLTVLTNRRALDAAGLALLAQLPISAEVKEWSEEAEHSVLAEALVALLPVNAQPFSFAKSLNRAVTGLSAGCQLLSTGYPLYEPFNAFLYKDAATLISDLSRGTMRFSEQRIKEFRATLEQVASPSTEAGRLAEFLGTLTPAAYGPLPLILIHGHSTRAEAHQMVLSLDGLSVSSPFCNAPLNFDVLFQGSPDGPCMFVSRRASRRLSPNVRGRLEGRIKIRGENFSYLPIDSRPSATVDRESLPIPFQLAVYQKWMWDIERQVSAAFGPSRIVHSEVSPLFPSMRPAP